MYSRPPGSQRADHIASKVFEDEVAAVLPEADNRTGSTTEVDFYVPGYFLEVKEKRQSFTERWLLLDGVDEKDIFILDELSFRRTASHSPNGYFLFKDVPGGERLFYANALEVACANKARANRCTSRDDNGEDRLKGKLILDMTQFRQLTSLKKLDKAIRADLLAKRWKDSECWAYGTIGQV